MRSADEIYKDSSTWNGDACSQNQRLILEVLLDIRDALHEKDEVKEQ